MALLTRQECRSLSRTSTSLASGPMALYRPRFRKRARQTKLRVRPHDVTAPIVSSARRSSTDLGRHRTGPRGQPTPVRQRGQLTLCDSRPLPERRANYKFRFGIPRIRRTNPCSKVLHPARSGRPVVLVGTQEHDDKARSLPGSLARGGRNQHQC